MFDFQKEVIINSNVLEDGVTPRFKAMTGAVNLFRVLRCANYRKEGLLEALKDFPEHMDYYLDKNSLLNSEILQGDGLNSLKIIQYETLATKNIRGILLSNSCDLDSNNSRDRGLKAVIAPIIKLSNYRLILERAGITEDKILAKLSSIKA